MSVFGLASRAVRCAFPFVAVAMAAAATDSSGADVAIEPARSAPWVLRVPATERVAFRGTVSYDAAGMGTASFLYPAPGPLGLLAAVVTHGVIVSSAQQRQKEQIQQEADRVLAPYEPVLSVFMNRQLIEAGVRRLPVGSQARLLEVAEAAGDERIVETAPVFSLTQDQRALVLDNLVRIFVSGSAKPVYAQTIRVVSMPLGGPAAGSPAVGEEGAPAQISAAWLESQGQRLTSQSAALFAESLGIAFADSAGAFGDPGAPHKTFRYPEGGRERMERAQFVANRCGYTVIRTLRGWLMAIPAPGGAGDAASNCPAGAGAG